MSLFIYKAINQDGSEIEGTIDAINRDVAINAIQRRGLVISSISEGDEVPFLQRSIGFLERVKVRDLVILSRQIATLFEAQVSALKVFGLLGAESENPVLRRALLEISDDIRGGSSISNALEKHPKIFSAFYINMVRVGEESGKLDAIFLELADYMDRTYEVGSKVRNALIYPAFVVVTFIGVMILMFTTVIPKISTILEDTGQEIPLYTKFVLSISHFLVDYGVFLIALALVGVVFLWRYLSKPEGKRALGLLKIQIPVVGNLYRMLYLSRIADNIYTMLTSGIPIIKMLETTSVVVGNPIYEEILLDAAQSVKDGASLSKAFGVHEEIPGIMTQMISIGEETGELGNIIKSLGNFYRREVNNAVDTVVDLIEPIMIVALGAGVGILLASILIPIYNIATGI